MTLPSPPLTLLPCLDSEEMAASCRKNLDIPRKRAEELGISAVELSDIGHYVNPAGERIDWSRLIQSARTAKESIPPGAQLRVPDSPRHTRTRVQVMNTTTLEAARGLDEGGLRPLALNFANGIQPGGGFQHGARAQEEVLCRSSALYSTLAGDPMYAYHRERPLPDSSDWAILSPDVPVFRTDGGEELERPWLLSFLTSAAPFAPTLCQPTSGDLLQKRISRILAIASSYGYDTLVLGAWGCGAFGNDPQRTALDFRRALETEFAGHFRDVVFAITDWSPERKHLGPFAAVFS